jgi:hypothetical protein
VLQRYFLACAALELLAAVVLFSSLKIEVELSKRRSVAYPHLVGPQLVFMGPKSIGRRL